MTLLQLNHTISCCDQTSFCNSSHSQIASLPCMIHWLSNYYCVAYSVHSNNGARHHSISQLLPHTVVKCVMLSWQNIKIICKMNKNVTRYRDNRKLGNKYAGSCILNCFVLSSPSLSSFTFKSSFSKHTVNALWDYFKLWKSVWIGHCSL